MTIKDIARLSGYSIGTVSRVINRHPDVSEEAREKILKIIEQENYQPNANAKHLKQSRNTAVTVIVKGTRNIFLNSILEKIQQYLRKYQEEASVVFVEESENEVRQAIQLETERNPKGFIFLGGALEHFRTDFHMIKAPSVLISGWAKDLGFDNLSSFSTDDFEGGRQAMEMLVNNGHRNVLIVGGFNSKEPEQVSSQRLNGALSVLKEHDIPFERDRQYIECRFSMQDSYEKLMDRLPVEQDITAIFGLSDLVAVGAMRAVHDSGRTVPDDISIIGYDGIGYTDYTVPRLSTVRQNVDELVAQGVDDLLYRIQYPREAVHRQISAAAVSKESIISIA